MPYPGSLSVREKAKRSAVVFLWRNPYCLSSIICFVSKYFMIFKLTINSITLLMTTSRDICLSFEDFVFDLVFENKLYILVQFSSCRDKYIFEVCIFMMMDYPIHFYFIGLLQLLFYMTKLSSFVITMTTIKKCFTNCQGPLKIN